MYKGASQKMQHALRVDRIDQRGVYLDDETPGTALPDVADMPLADLKAERETLTAERLRWANQRIAAQHRNDMVAQRRAGGVESTICQRLSLVNAEIKNKNRALNDSREPKKKAHFWRLLCAEIGKERAQELREQAERLADEQMAAEGLA